VISLTIFLKRTTVGLAIRAAAEDFQVTQLMGIRANRVVATAFAISGLLAGFVGFLWIAQRGSVDPHIGLNPTIKAFIAVIFGGVGSLSGAVAGGLILGFIEVSLPSSSAGSAAFPGQWPEALFWALSKFRCEPICRNPRFLFEMPSGILSSPWCCCAGPMG
jgi:branched-subunit amino acid ABC-type transport system permease component